MLDRYVIFTSHARQRAHEFQISLAKATWLVYTSDVNDLPKELKRAKNAKYKDRAVYRRNGTYLFTLLPATDNQTGDEIYLVITMYDQRMDLK